MTRKKKRVALLRQPEVLPAGEFSAWLGQIGAGVPCGTCTACCRSSLFVHIRPGEVETRARIPPALLFPVPGLPSGNVLMGYDEQGKCPMLIDDRCSIYEHRPQTCRDFDCRVFAATDTRLDAEQAAIAERVRAWRFEHADEHAVAQRSAVRMAAEFLREHRDCFPDGALPSNPAQLAILAIKVYRVFLRPNASARSQAQPPASEIASAVMQSLARLEGLRDPIGANDD